jgi:hypothetical protein
MQQSLQRNRIRQSQKSSLEYPERQKVSSGAYVDHI